MIESDGAMKWERIMPVEDSLDTATLLFHSVRSAESKPQEELVCGDRGATAIRVSFESTKDTSTHMEWMILIRLLIIVDRRRRTREQEQ